MNNSTDSDNNNKHSSRCGSSAKKGSISDRTSSNDSVAEITEATTKIGTMATTSDATKAAKAKKTITISQTKKDGSSSNIEFIDINNSISHSPPLKRQKYERSSQPFSTQPSAFRSAQQSTSTIPEASTLVFPETSNDYRLQMKIEAMFHPKFDNEVPPTATKKGVNKK